jgi:hypothetical protein
MSIVRSPVRSVVRSPVQGVFGGSASLLEQATSALGNVAPYHYLDFINNRALYASTDVGNVTGATGYSFTRASDGYYQNADGTLTLFGSGALRRGNRGVLIEGARTNLLLRSQEFDNASWVKTNCTVTANAVVAPDGTMTADLVQFSAQFANIRENVQTLVAGTTYTYSIFCRVASGTRQFSVRDNIGVELGTFTATTTWARYTITYTAGNTTALLAIQDRNASGFVDTYIWGVQNEAAAFPSSYIPTTTASATRASDSLVYTAGVSYPASLWCEFDRGVASALGQVALQLDGGDDTNRSTIRANASGEAEAVMASGGATQAQMPVAGAMTPGTASKVAARYSTNSVQICRAGTLGTEDTSATVPAAITTLRLGARAAGDQYLFGYVARAAVFNSALVNGNLQLTAPA